MSEAGQPSTKTPDLIPGWFEARKGNPDPAMREAVRIPEAGDYFPITFLRDTERVAPASDHRGFTVGPTSQSGHDRFDLAVVPGCWLVRDADLGLHVRTNEEFTATYTRSDRKWTATADRFRDNPHLSDEDRERYASSLAERGEVGHIGHEGVAGAEADISSTELAKQLRDELVEGEGWKGTPPAEGTRRKLIFDALEAFSLRLISGTGGRVTRGSCLEAADAVESALLREAIDDDGREADAQEAINAVGEALDLIDAPQGATFAERIDRLYRELRSIDAPGSPKTADSIEGLCTNQRESHDRLRYSDTDFAEYHRGARGAYDLILAWLKRNPNRTLKRSPIHDQLDRVGIRRTDPGPGPKRILTLAERVEALIRRYQAQQSSTDGLADLAVAQADVIADKSPVPAGTRELHIVLAEQDGPEGHHAFFIELEDQDGRGIGGFERRQGKPGLTHIVIPYDRVTDVDRLNAIAEERWQRIGELEEQLLELTDRGEQRFNRLERIYNLASEIGGPPRQLCDLHADLHAIASIARPDHPAEPPAAATEPGEVREYDPEKEGPPEWDGGDESRCDQLLGEREEARAGESRFAEERDCAFALLRWLLPVMVPKRID